LTAPWVVGLALLALVVAGAAAWTSVRRVDALDPELWFKVILATLLRGEVERNAGTADDWETAVRRWVWYHPAGRNPERKVVAPELHPVEGTWLPGERALQAQLAQRATLADRWRWLYDEDPSALTPCLAPPEDHGAAYDLRRVLGPAGSWDALAAWSMGSSEFAASLARRLDAWWILVDGDREDPKARAVLAALASDVAGAEGRAAAVRLSLKENIEDAAKQCIHAVPADGVESRRPVVFVAVGGALPAVLAALLAEPVLRDRTVAVVALGEAIRGVEGHPWSPRSAGDWLDRNFRPSVLDTELRRPTLYASLAWLDRRAEPPGALGVPLDKARFPKVPDEDAPSAIHGVDLGVFPLAEDLPALILARALRTFVAVWTLHHR
jgi:hypothetical protein